MVPTLCGIKNSFFITFCPFMLPFLQRKLARSNKKARGADKGREKIQHVILIRPIRIEDHHSSSDRPHTYPLGTYFFPWYRMFVCLRINKLGNNSLPDYLVCNVSFTMFTTFTVDWLCTTLVS